MENKKFFLMITSLAVIILSVVVFWVTLTYYKEYGSLIVSSYFGVLGIAIPIILWSIDSKKSETKNRNNIQKHCISGYVSITFLVLSGIYILITLLFQWDYKFIIAGVIVFLISAIWTFILGILSKQSLSGQETCIVEPEKFWRVIWNMLPAHFGLEINPILNVLIIYSAEGECQVKQMQQRYEQAKDELLIDQQLCDINNKKQLKNKLAKTNYIGIHLIYTEDIKSKMPWVRELCYEWANNNKSKPIVYTNCTNEDQPLNYGASNKDSDGILRLFQRTHTLSESWREQSNIQHKFLKWLSFFFTLILIGFTTLFLNQEQKPIVLVGGGTVKNYIENRKLSNSKHDLLFIQVPSDEACERMDDDGFMEPIKERLIIMSSKRQDNTSFKLENLSDKYKPANILEIFLDYDTMYVKSKGVKWDAGEKMDGITLKALTEKLNKDTTITVYRTNKGSGTYDFYERLIDTIKNPKDTYTFSSSKKLQEKNNYIVLTRSWFDPLHNNGENNITKIFIRDSIPGPKSRGELFLYIPIQEEKKDKLIIPKNIKEFIKDLRGNFNLNLEHIRGSRIITDPNCQSK